MSAPEARVPDAARSALSYGGSRAQVFDARPGILLLMHRAEVSSRLQLSFLANCFHSWRCEAQLLRAGHCFKNEFQRSQDAWRALLDETEQKGSSKAMQLRDNITRTIFRLSQTSLGSCFAAWQRLLLRSSRDSALRNRVCLSFAHSLKEADWAIRHLCFSTWVLTARSQASEDSWRQRAAKEEETWRQRLDEMENSWQQRLDEEKLALQQRFEAEHGSLSVQLKQRLEEESSSWRQRLEEECSRGESRLQVALDAVEQTQLRTQRDILSLLGRWEAGGERDLVTLAMRGWRRLASSAQVHRVASRSVAERLAENFAVGSLSTCLRRWHSGCVERRRDLSRTFHLWRWQASLLSQVHAQRDSVTVALKHLMDRECSSTAEQCFWQWKAMTSTAQHARTLDAELHARSEAWDAQSAEERRRHRSAVAEHRAKLEKAQSQAAAVANFAMVGWEVASLTDFVLHLLRAWSHHAREAGRRTGNLRRVSAILGAMMQDCDKTSLSAAFSQWQAATVDCRVELARSSAYDERRRGQLEVYSLTNRVSEVLSRKWQMTAGQSVLRIAFSAWRQFQESCSRCRSHSDAARGAVERCFAMGSLSLMRMCLLSWVCSAEVGKLQRSVENEHATSLQKLEEEASALAAEGHSHATSAVQAREQLEQAVLERDQAQRELSLIMQQHQRYHEMSFRKNRRLQAASLELLACKDWAVAVLELFLAWRDVWRQSVEEYRLLSTTEGCVELLQRRLSRHRQFDVQRTCMVAWQREARSEDAASRQELQTLVEEAKQEKASLEERLDAASRQVEELSASLQSEIQCRNELAEELQQAYDSKPSTPAKPPTSAWPSRPVAPAGMPGRRSSSLGRLERRTPQPPVVGGPVREVVREALHGSESPSTMRRPTRVERAGFGGRLQEEQQLHQETEESWRSEPGPRTSRQLLQMRRAESAGSLADRVGSLNRSRSGSGRIACTSQGPGHASAFAIGSSTRRGESLGNRTPAFPGFADSPSRCSWDAAVEALQDEGILRIRE